MKEDEVYISTKAFLIKQSWTLLAGQPPNGCDHLPVVEIKMSERIGIGSFGSYKPDLIASKNGIFLIIECKPDHSIDDAKKILSILSDQCRVENLYEEILQRRLFERRGIIIHKNDFRANLWGALAHSGIAKKEEKLLVLTLRNINGDGELLPPEIADKKLLDTIESS